MINLLPLQMTLSMHQKRDLLDGFWNDRPVRCPKHGLLMRGEFVERVFESQVVFTCPRCHFPDLPILRDLPGQTFPDVVRLPQKAKQIRFSESHLRTLVRDAQEREQPNCPVDNSPLFVERMPARHFPGKHDFAFTCPTCFSWGVWIDTGVKEEAVKDTAAKTADYAFHDETLKLPARLEIAEKLIAERHVEAKPEKNFLLLYAAMAQTDCTACGYDCEGYARAIADGKEKDLNLCVPGKDETAAKVHQIMAV